ncbi:hypothetical protein HID58_046298, partial [Brassica napus]
PKVMEIVRRGWNKVSSGNGSLVSDRIRACRKELSKWKRSEDCNTKKKLLKEGMIRSIGDGSNTYVWSDKWIMESQPRHPVNKQRNIDVLQRVSTLIDESVRSGYSVVAFRQPLNRLLRSPAEQAVIDLKKKLRKVPTLSKIRLFLWRAVSGALAVTERLNSRGLNVDATCKLCNNADETINHVMFQCQPALDILESVQFPQDSSPPRSLVENFHLILKLLSDMSVMENYRTVIPWFLWAIWKNRNSIPGPAQREGQS